MVVGEDNSGLLKRIAKDEEALETVLSLVTVEELAKYLGEKADPAASMYPIKIQQRILTALRAAMTDAELAGSDAVSNLRKRVETGLTQIIRKGAVGGYAELGLSPSDLAELLTQLALDVGYGKYNLAQLRAGGWGLFQYFRGKLNELYFITRSKLVNEIVLNTARRDAASLNEALRGKGTLTLPNILFEDVVFDGRVVAGTAGSVRLPGFGPVRTATKIWLIMRDGTRQEYTDLMHVTEFIRADGANTNQFAALTAVEFKAGPASAKGFGGQIGEALLRAQDAVQIEMLLDGSEKRVIDVKSLILSPGEFNRIGIAPGKVDFPERGDDWTISFTEKGGYLESFVQITAAVDTTPLDSAAKLLCNAMGLLPSQY
jgi:hypothetical protein